MFETLKKHKVIVIIVIVIVVILLLAGIYSLIAYFETKWWPFGEEAIPEIPAAPTYTKTNLKIGKPMPCPGKNVLPNTNADSYCIVKEAEAPAICNSMTNCFGYGVTTNAAHRYAYPDSAQLTSGDLVDNPDWATYVKKL